MKSHISLIILLLVAALIVGSDNLPSQSTAAQPFEQISTAAPDITCNELVTLAETTVGLVCNGIGRNQACYGNRLVSVDFVPDSNFTFRQSGDVVDLVSIRRLSTSPLNMNTRDWGIAVVKAQANLPDALPGQNVTFLLFGDTTLDSPTPDMRAVTVSTRIGGTTCEDAPSNGVLIQSPTGSQVEMNINGADVTLGSTAFVTTNEATQRMTFAVLEGTGVISAFGTTQIVVPGQKTGIQLGGGPDGLQASGPPNEPAPYDPNTMVNIPTTLLERPVVVPPPLDVTATPTEDATPRIIITARPSGNIRTGDDTVYPIVTSLPTGATARILGISSTGSGWYQIQMDDGRVGWASPVIFETAGDLSNLPFIQPPPRPTNTPTPRPTLTPTVSGPIGPNLRADHNPIGYKDCTTIRWDVENISQVYFEGQGVTGHDSREVCPGRTTTYTLLVVLLDNTQRTYTITINVEAVCGNQICEPGESYSTCSADCLG